MMQEVFEGALEDIGGGVLPGGLDLGGEALLKSLFECGAKGILCTFLLLWVVLLLEELFLADAHVFGAAEGVNDLAGGLEQVSLFFVEGVLCGWIVGVGVEGEGEVLGKGVLDGLELDVGVLEEKGGVIVQLA